MKKRSCISFIMIVLLMISIMPINATEIGTEHWAQKTINQWMEKGLLEGDDMGNINPDQPITRAESAVLLDRIFKYVDVTDISSKIDKNMWYYTAMSKVYAADIVKGDQNGNLHPNSYITREEMAVIIYRAYQLETLGESRICEFSDKDNISNWAVDAISLLGELNIINGRSNNMFEPFAQITRAEAITMIERVTGELIQEEGIYSKDVTGNLTVNTRNVTLDNMIIGGDLFLAHGIADGDINLNQVTVLGRTIIQGGGENSIIIANSSLEGNLIVLKINGKIRVVAEGDSSIPQILLRSGAKLESNGNASFGNVEIMTVKSGQAIELEGDFEEVKVSVSEVDIKVPDGRIGSMIINEQVKKANIDINEKAEIESIEAHAPTNITGDGNVKALDIQSEGVEIERKPEKVINDAGHNAVIEGKDSNAGTTEKKRRKRSYQMGAVITQSSIQIVPIQLGEKINKTYKTTETGIKTWSSSNNEVATINKDTGEITAISSGTTEISYKTNTYKTNKLLITVLDAAPSINPTYKVVQVSYGDVNPDQLILPQIGESILWTSSEESFATINPVTGTITPIAEGDTIISYKITNTEGLVTQKGVVNVHINGEFASEPIVGIGTINTVLQMGETESRTAATTHAHSIKWQSSDTSVATINETTGVVTAVSEGTSIINYSSDMGNNRITIQVHGQPQEDNPTTEAIHIGWGTVLPTSYTVASTDETIEWKSSDITKATIDSTSGEITPVAEGNSTISYKVVSDITGKVIIKGAQEITILEESNGAIIYGIGDVSNILQIGEKNNSLAGTSETGNITWVNFTPDILTLDPIYSSCIVIGKRSGMATIGYKSDSGGRNKLTFEVYGPATIDNPEIDLVKKGLGNFQATSFTTAGTNESINWFSSDEAIATVNSSGLVTPISAGEVEISYKVINDVSGVVTVKGQVITEVVEQANELDTFVLSEGKEYDMTQITQASSSGAQTYKYRIQVSDFSEYYYVGMDEPSGYTEIILSTDVAVNVGEYMVIIALDNEDKIVSVTSHEIGLSDIMSEKHFFISDYTNNRIVKLNSKTITTDAIVTDIDTNAYSGPMAIDYSDEHIYWAQQEGEFILRSELDGTNVESLIDTNNNDISAIEIDHANSKIYWAEYNNKKIYQANMDGSNIVCIIADSGHIVDMEINDNNIYLLKDETGNIMKANLDGSNYVEFIVTGLSAYAAVDMVIDSDGEKIYWTDALNNQIVKGDISTGLLESVVVNNADTGTNNAGLSYITIYGEKIYWICESSGNIKEAYVDGSEITDLYLPNTVSGFTGLEVRR